MRFVPFLCHGREAGATSVNWRIEPGRAVLRELCQIVFRGGSVVLVAALAGLGATGTSRPPWESARIDPSKGRPIALALLASAH